MKRDLAFAVRSLWRRPLSSAAAIATFAIGIGVNGAVFSVVDWVLVRPLPYPAAHELVRIETAGTNPATPPADLTPSEVAAIQESRIFRAAVAFSTATRIVAAPGVDPAHAAVARISGDLSATLGVFPERGRSFTIEEASAGVPLVVLSHGLWDRQFRGDVHVVGKTLTIDGAPHTVVGVMPAGRGYPVDADLWRPATAEEREDDDRELRAVARLQPGVSPITASSKLSTLVSGVSNGARTAWADPMQQTEVREVERALTALLAAAFLIMLIACANVGALIAAGGADRAAELAVRQALGAGRSQLIRQLLAESVVLALAGGAAGLLIGGWTLDAIIAIAPAALPRLAEISLDVRVIGIGIVSTVAVGIAVGLVPAFRASSREGGRTPLHGVAPGRVTRRSNGRRVMVAAQIAMAVVLTVGAGLLGQSLRNLVTAGHGFDPERLISIDLYLRGSYSGDTNQLFRQLMETAESTPGVSGVSVAMRLPTQTAGLRAPITLAGESRQPVPAILRPVSARYFDIAAIAVRSGRRFEDTDTRESPRVAILNTSAARAAFADRSAIGSRIRTPLIDGPLEIVGIVDDVTPGGEADRPALYVPVTQLGIGSGYLIVRAEQEPESVVPALRERFRGIAPWLALDRIQLVRHSLEASRAATRFNSALAGTFAILALLLAAIGVYGLTASEVAARWRELAVRLALGSSQHEALWTVLKPCVVVLTGGAAAGLAGALGLAPRLATLLFRIEPDDVRTLTAAPLLLACTGLAAATLAAVKVLRADPASTLRGE